MKKTISVFIDENVLRPLDEYLKAHAMKRSPLIQRLLEKQLKEWGR